MRILFLDQSGKPGGAELFLVDLATFYGDRCLVILFTSGAVEHMLKQHQVPVHVMSFYNFEVRKQSGILAGLAGLAFLSLPLTCLIKPAQNYDVIYANTPKALIAGAVLHLLCRRPLVYHLHDILSADHFSSFNRWIIVTIANRFSSLVIANSQAAQASFVDSGGRSELTRVVYNGFKPEHYRVSEEQTSALRKQLDFSGKYVVGHFSRLSPWKGQHVLLEALTDCPEDVVALFVGDALFGEEDYVAQLHRQVAALGLETRVAFLGFRQDVPQLMSACDLVAHTSTAPEPFGRVIVEAMLCRTPVVAAAAGGALELVEPGNTGWLVPPGDRKKLAQIIMHAKNQPEETQAIAKAARQYAEQVFDLRQTNQQIAQSLQAVMDAAQYKSQKIL